MNQNPTFGDYMPEDGDVVIFVRRRGRAATAWLREGDKIHAMPLSWETIFAPGGGLKPIRVSAKAGWTRKQWKERQLDRVSAGDTVEIAGTITAERSLR